MTSDIIQAAIEQLRASVEALPEEISRGAWEVAQGHVIREAQSGYHAAKPTGWRGLQAEAAIADHIALTASPHVTEALVRLLEAISEHDSWDTDVAMHPYTIIETGRALAEAITHRSTT